MTVEVDRDALVAALRKVADVVEARNTIPVLSNLLVEVADGTLTLIGTDLDLQASACVEASGSLLTTIDKNKLLAAVTSFGPGRVTISEVEGRAAVKLRSGRGVRTLPTLSAKDFPRREGLEDATAFSMNASTLLRLLNTTSIAHSADEVRYYLKGTYLHVRDGALFAAATDGHRAVRCQIDLPPGAEGMPGIIVPTKSVSLLRKLLGKADGEVRFAANRKAYECRIGGTTLSGKLIDGTFPDYERVIPPPAPQALVGMRDALIEPVTAVAAVVNAEGDQKVRTVVIDLPGGGKDCEVSAKDTTGASAVETLDVEARGAPIRFGVNYRYLTAVLGIFAENGSLTITINDPAAPMRVTSDKDPDLIAVIMPMRV